MVSGLEYVSLRQSSNAKPDQIGNLLVDGF